MSSSSVFVADSPVVPLTTRPSWPSSSTRCDASRPTPSTSSDPSSAKGVTIAVSITPKGLLSVVGPGMGQGYRYPWRAEIVARGGLPYGATRPFLTKAACVIGMSADHTSSYFSATISISRWG